MEGYIYIIQSQKNNKLYTGCSENPQKRLYKFHNLGKVQATKYLTPWKLVFFQQYENMTIARKIEYKLKKLKSRTILEKIIKDGVCQISIS